MAFAISILAADENGQRQMQAVVQMCATVTPAGPPLLLPPAAAGEGALQPLLAQAPAAVLLELPERADGVAAALEVIAWLRQRQPRITVMAVGRMEDSQLIVRALRAGAGEYLEKPLRAAALAEAVARCAGARSGERPRLWVVAGARGGSGATTVAVNLALALQAQTEASAPPVLLLDAAPLGHASLHLNLKPAFTLHDVAAQGTRLDASLLRSLTVRHRSGLELLAGPSEPLPERAAEAHAGWIELVGRCYPLAVADVSTRRDGLTQALLEAAERVLVVAPADVVSLWSAAKVRPLLDAFGRRPCELVLNQQGAVAGLDAAGLERLTGMAVLWKVPAALDVAAAAIERGEPAVLHPSTELARSLIELGALLLGRSGPRRARGWRELARWRPWAAPVAGAVEHPLPAEANS